MTSRGQIGIGRGKNWGKTWRRAVAALFVLLATGAAHAQKPPAADKAPAMAEAPSTVNATYVEPSAERELKPGEKIGQLYTRNNTQPFILQRLTKRTYWVQSQHYGTIFYVGDKGVLLFDPLQGHSDAIQQAIAQVTKLPLTALVYSHDHADHIGDAKAIVDAVAKAPKPIKLRIIASKATADKMTLLKSGHPKPTETVAWPRGNFRFEGLTVELHGFVRAAHADDHGIWFLRGEKVAHLPDHINPDQPPFWAFAGSENFLYYEANLEELAKLDWVFLSSGHGNIGARVDVDFYRTFIADLKEAVGKAMQETKFGEGVDATKVNAHTAFLPAWISAVAKKATDAMRPKYGRTYGFDYATPRNAEMVAMVLFSYR